MQTEWDSITSRVHGLQVACGVFYPAVESKGSDYYGVSNSSLIPLAREIYADIESLRRKYENQLAPSARTAIDEFLQKHARLFTNANGLAGVGATTVALSAIAATVTTLLADREARARSITDRAFAHLQRLLVADEEVRAKWQRAFARGEVACEGLGGAHLLQHGIFAFKVTAQGERTDLVFGEPLEIGEAERTSPSALVLTEWKLARTGDEVEAKLEEARRQAALYAGGSISDLELTTVRFAVVLAEKRRDVANEVRDGAVVYRQVVLAVNPDAPSAAARRPAPAPSSS
jgi:hypothetical protein